MPLPVLLLSVSLLGPAPDRPLVATDPVPGLAVEVDSSRRTLTLRAGPFLIPGAAKTDAAHAHHGAHDAPGAQTPFLTFDWPVTGWIYAFEIELLDGEGRPLARSLIHHVNMMNLERRALLYDAVERTLAAGSETADVALPRTVGFPMTAGTRMGILAAWANDSDRPVEGVQLVVRYRWSPANLNPRPVDVLPLYMDVNYRGAGQSDSYDLPAGRSERSHEFTLPIDGRLLGAGGHLHDHAIEVRLEEVATGKEVVRLEAKLGAGRKIEGVEQKIFGVRGDGIRLHRDRRYRITAVYDNQTGATIPSGAMGIMIGLFAPQRIEDWPRVEATNPGIRADLAAILQGASTGRP